jgi:hypothetical protein
MARPVDWSSTTITVLRAAGSRWICAFAKFPSPREIFATKAYARGWVLSSRKGLFPDKA